MVTSANCRITYSRWFWLSGHETQWFYFHNLIEIFSEVTPLTNSKGNNNCQINDFSFHGKHDVTHTSYETAFMLKATGSVCYIPEFRYDISIALPH